MFSKYARNLEAKIENNINPTKFARLSKNLEQVYAFQKFFSINKTRDELTSKLYNVYVKRGDEAESTLLGRGGRWTAVDIYTQAITLAPERFEAYEKRGMVLHELGEFSDAIKDYEKAGTILSGMAGGDITNVGITWANARIYSRMGDSYLLSKDYGNAEKHFGYAVIYYKSASTSWPEGKRAEDDYERLASGHQAALIGMGYAKLGQAQYVEAKECFDEAAGLPVYSLSQMDPAYRDLWVAVEKAGLLQINDGSGRGRYSIKSV